MYYQNFKLGVKIGVRLFVGYFTVSMAFDIWQWIVRYDLFNRNTTTDDI